MQPIPTLRKALWSTIPFLDGNKTIPLRHVAVLLFILEQEETSSPDIQEALQMAQGVASRTLSDLRAYGLIESYKGSGANSRRDMAAPSEKGKKLAKTLTKIMEGVST